MERKNIKKFPISHYKKFLNKMGRGYVPCQISGRGIIFPEKSYRQPNDGEFIEIDIITHPNSLEEDPKKICHLVITREALERALARVKTNT